MLEATEAGRTSPLTAHSNKSALWAKARGVLEQVCGWVVVRVPDVLSMVISCRCVVMVT